MENKPLIETNPYLKDPAKRQATFSITVSSLTAIEGVYAAVTKEIKAVRNLLNLSSSLNPPESKAYHGIENLLHRFIVVVYTCLYCQKVFLSKREISFGDIYLSVLTCPFINIVPSQIL